MSEFPEFVQLRAIAGTNKLLRETANREGKKLSEIMREALETRLGQRREDDEPRAA